MKLVKNGLLFGVVTAVTLTLAPAAYSQASLTETATVIGACGKLFEVDADAAGLAARDRAAIIQKNLDYALVHAKNRSPNAVSIVEINHNPVVMFSGYQIATADGNSAARHQMTQLQLAQQWANSLRMCLANGAAVQKYVSELTGCFPPVVTQREERVAYARAGMYMPVKLLTPLNSECSHLGDCVQVELTQDIPLPTSQSSTQYEAYLPAGSIAIGQLIDASNSYTRNGALALRFDTIRTPDGELIPINGHILGGIGTWVYFNSDQGVTQFSGINGNRLTATNGLVAEKGNICGGWRGYPIGAGLDIPFQKMVLKRRTGIKICAGEPMLLQLAAPTTVAVCTNCAPTGAVANTTITPAPVAIGGVGNL